MGNYAPPSGYFRLNAFDPLIEVGKRTAVWAVNEDDALTRGSLIAVGATLCLSTADEGYLDDLGTPF